MAHTKELILLEDGYNEEEEGVVLTLDRAFERAGEFGKFQKRFFAIILMFQIVAVFHVLPITFVGLEPNWKCTGKSSNASLSQKCALYEKQGACTPEYIDRFHSITQEVQ